MEDFDEDEMDNLSLDFCIIFGISLVLIFGIFWREILHAFLAFLYATFDLLVSMSEAVQSTGVHGTFAENVNNFINGIFQRKE